MTSTRPDQAHIPDLLSAERIEAALRTTFVGRHLVYLPETGSTNDLARRLARTGAPEGTVVIADHQVAGRGRLQRRWEAPPGSSLLMSLVFRPTLRPVQAHQLTMVCGLAVVDAVESELDLSVGLKWPNDIALGGAKAGGILTELELKDDQVEHAVVGIGLNVNLDPALLPGDFLTTPTSLSHALGHSVARLPLLAGLLQAVEQRYLRLRQGHSPHKEWAGRLVNLGQPVSVSGSGPAIEGMAEGVDPDGALLVRLDDGSLETIVAGDVTLRFGKRPSHLL
jgi:BirA family biotin operon repressor/biotin-[acetyl-CoA-carboxylase] ligase